MSKLAFVPGLGPAARKLLPPHACTHSAPHASCPARKTRVELCASKFLATRVRYDFLARRGASTAVYVRIARTRETDPAHYTPLWKDCAAGSREWPSLDACVPAHVEIPRRGLPTWDQQGAVLARDPLACVHGFRILVQLTLQHLFGLNLCGAIRVVTCKSPRSPVRTFLGAARHAVAEFLVTWMQRT